MPQPSMTLCKQLVFCLLLCLATTAQSQAKKELALLHAGSLALPIKAIGERFMQLHPDVMLKPESAGSVECARKILDNLRPCDVFLSADESVIDRMLIPVKASWRISFAGNEIVFAMSAKSYAKADRTDPKECFLGIMNGSINAGRANPDLDPCGYRSVWVLQLAQTHYAVPGLSSVCLEKTKNNIRPKEVDMLALVESGALDGIFIYKSVALQHKMKIISFPPQVNLQSIDQKETYRKASVEIKGKKPAETITMQGEPIVYGLTIPQTAANKELAEEFVRFVLDRQGGLAMLDSLGHPSLATLQSTGTLPATLQRTRE